MRQSIIEALAEMHLQSIAKYYCSVFIYMSFLRLSCSSIDMNIRNKLGERLLYRKQVGKKVILKYMWSIVLL